jgi:hypothetical protein
MNESTVQESTCNPPIKAGDLLYAVGPDSCTPLGTTSLKVYSTIVTGVSKNASEVLMIALDPDPPTLGFPKWTCHDYDIGIHVHRSRIDAVRAFYKQAHHRLHAAARALEQANEEIQWALDEEGSIKAAAACGERFP